MVPDVDGNPEWIYIINTVMDDYKVLMHVFNERIFMTTFMCMLLEIE